MDFYIVITQEFAENLNGVESTVTPRSHFGYGVTLDNRYVCSINSANDFPEEFAEIAPLEVVALNVDAFPVTPPIE